MRHHQSGKQNEQAETRGWPTSTHVAPLKEPISIECHNGSESLAKKLSPPSSLSVAIVCSPPLIFHTFQLGCASRTLRPVLSSHLPLPYYYLFLIIHPSLYLARPSLVKGKENGSHQKLPPKYSRRKQVPLPLDGRGSSSPRPLEENYGRGDAISQKSVGAILRMRMGFCVAACPASKPRARPVVKGVFNFSLTLL